ncbi:hypothetical protein [Flavihumibacter profundi]|uniref:hypothetical protein n=1 Tax=Flavihumibacter profundi TaxID=2716883 RepID=UPI001CC74685|nr:hypothetical protein [Flavihumibacter profundi]MBZ5856239.1 hypothetical protein [Flavihumibacter profundi]
MKKIFVRFYASLVVFHINLVKVSIAMNVGIQETDHFEGVYPVIRLFDNGHNQLFIFVNQLTYTRLIDLLGPDAGKFHWIIQEEKESSFSFCLKIRKAIIEHHIRLLYLNTVSKHHLWYALILPFGKTSRSILTVHDVNCLFRDKPGLSPRKMIKYLGKKLLTARVQSFNTVAETVKPYLLKVSGGSKEVFTIPGAVYENQPVGIPPYDHINIAIPGSIDNKRRNYPVVFELANMLKGLPVTITLLGGGDNEFARNIWNQCRDSISANLVWFETKIVDQHIFDEILDLAHFIWIPSVIHTTICGKIPETYGITKSSGNIFDIVKHAKPFIYPASLQVPGILKKAGYSYGSVEDIRKLIIHSLQNPGSYEELATAAREASGNFTVENLRKQFAPLFDQVPGNV